MLVSRALGSGASVQNKHDFKLQASTLDCRRLGHSIASEYSCQRNIDRCVSRISAGAVLCHCNTHSRVGMCRGRRTYTSRVPQPWQERQYMSHAVRSITSVQRSVGLHHSITPSTLRIAATRRPSNAGTARPRRPPVRAQHAASWGLRQPGDGSTAALNPRDRSRAL
jgi:hypothetical protein